MPLQLKVMSQEELMLEKKKLESPKNTCCEVSNELSKVTLEEENNSLLPTGFENTGNTDNRANMKFYNGEDGVQEGNKSIITSNLERNLYPNVLVSPSREQSDIDTDEEDFQLRSSSNHRRNDSGQGSSITDSSLNCNDFKKIDLNDDENLPDENIDDIATVDSAICQSKPEHELDISSSEISIPEVPELDKNVTDVLSKIQEGSEVVLTKSRTSSKNTLNDTTSNSKLDETDFTDIPLNSPANKPHMNTYAPRAEASTNEEVSDVSGDLRKPSITDAKPRSGLKLFKKDPNKSWKLFGNHPVRIAINKSNNDDKKSEIKSKKPALATSTTGLIFENRPLNLPPKSIKEEQHHRLLYNEMLKGAKKREMKEMDQEIKKTKQQYQIENEKALSLKIWRDEVLVNWETLKTTKKVKDLWWNGLPSSIRGKIWKLAIGNDLRVTSELFQIMRAHAQERIASQKYQEPVATLHDNESSLVVSKENTVGLISLDVARTFPALCIFQKGGPYHESLKNLLGAYTCYRPDVGYVQGMSFIAAMLLLNMDAVDAFICFANIMHKPCQMAFFMVNQPMMEAYFKTFDVMLEESCPRIHQHLRTQKLSHDIYLIDWIFTIYSKSLPLDIASRVWDLFCRDGEDFLFRTALGILNLHQETLLSLDFFRLAQYLTKLSHDVQSEKLFQSIATVNFNRQRFHQVLNFHKSMVPESDIG